MSAEAISPETLVAVLDAAIITFAVLGVLALRRLRPPMVRDVRDAFRILDRTIEKFVPDLPRGFTWGEALERFKGYGIQADWPKMESTLAQYEAFRYGGRDMPAGGGDEVVRFSTLIRRNAVGYRSKGEGTRSD